MFHKEIELQIRCPVRNVPSILSFPSVVPCAMRPPGQQGPHSARIMGCRLIRRVGHKGGCCCLAVMAETVVTTTRLSSLHCASHGDNARAGLPDRLYCSLPGRPCGLCNNVPATAPLNFNSPVLCRSQGSSDSVGYPAGEK